jgi:hypothetical protein
MSTDFESCPLQASSGGKLDLHSSWFVVASSAETAAKGSSQIEDWMARSAGVLGNSSRSQRRCGRRTLEQVRVSGMAVTGRASPWTKPLGTSTTGTLPLPRPELGGSAFTVIALHTRMFLSRLETLTVQNRTVSARTGDAPDVLARAPLEFSRSVCWGYLLSPAGGVHSVCTPSA